MTDRSFCTVGLGGSPPKFTAAALSLLVNESVRLTNARRSELNLVFTRHTYKGKSLWGLLKVPIPAWRRSHDSISCSTVSHYYFGGGLHRKSGRATPVMTSSFENVSDGSRYFCQGNAYGFRMLVQEGWSLELDYGGPFQLTL